MKFVEFKQAFQSNFQRLVKENTTLFHTNTDKDILWQTYLNSFPEEGGYRQLFSCNSCRQFIKNYGNLVIIKDNKLTSIWNFNVNDEEYQAVLDRLDQVVRSSEISNVFIPETQKLGTDHNLTTTADGTVITWHHLSSIIPRSFIPSLRGTTIESLASELRQSKQVFKRSLDELTIDATDTVLDLISQNSLYRGEEFKGLLQSFKKYQEQYASLKEKEKDNYCWANFRTSEAVARIRNTAIGTLLIDVSIDTELEVAVRKFESVMAPANYRRPNAIVSKKMIADAEKKIIELGLENSLARRFALPEDVPSNQVLFINRNNKSKAVSSVFDSLKEEVPINLKSLERVEEIKLDKFIDQVLPTARSIKLLLENKHESNLVSLIAPVNGDAPSILKWDNKLSWCYNNNTADSIKEKVKKAGGQVQGLLRVSLAWYTTSDLDLWLIEPNKNKIYYGDKRSSTGGQLDVDQNVSIVTRTPVENIIYPYNCNIRTGNYEIVVHNFTDRETTSEFTVEVELNGELFTFVYNKPIRSKQAVVVAKFHYDRNQNTIKFFESIDCKTTTQTKDMWSLKTNTFHPVKMMCYSPNHWKEPRIGNCHVFFMLDRCHNPTKVRGIFNEMIKEELHRDHKRVFEALASKMEVEESDRRLSGVGFSTTNKNSFYVEVESTFIRQLKVTI